MAILDHGAFSDWSTAFDHLERLRARRQAAQALDSVELLAYTTGELAKAEERYNAAVRALKA